MSRAGSSQGLPHGWALVELSAVTRINPPLDRCVVNDSVGVDFVPMRSVEPEGGGLLHPEVVNFGKVKKGYTAFLPGDVIMAKITPCMENGKTCVVPALPGIACFGSTEFHVVRAERGLEAGWVSNFLLQHSTRHAAQRQMTGGVGQMRVPSAFLESLKLPLPPSEEQQRIGEALDELLSDLDAGIAALERAREKLKLYRASVLKAAVEGALTAEWRAQHPDAEPASELLQRILVERRRRWEAAQLKKFKEAGKPPPKNWKAKYKEPVTPDTSDLPVLPDGWCWASLDQLGETQGGLQKSPARAPKKSHYPYLRVANVLRGALDLRDLHRFELSEAELARLRLVAGDLLIIEGNGSRTEIGRCAIWQGEVEDCVHQNHVIRVRLLAGIKPEYAYRFLNSPAGQVAIQLVASSTSGLYTLSVGKIEKLPIPVPPEIEQDAIIDAVDEQLSDLDHLEADLDAKLKSAQALRQSILRDAFAGKLVPQDPNDEPASVLLERIATEREQREREMKAAKKSKSTATHKRARKNKGTTIP